MIKAQDKQHLKEFIAKDIEQHGNKCDLNYVDVSKVINMSRLFDSLAFNGDISQWNTSSV